jgi:serine/threonine-protein kinase
MSETFNRGLHVPPRGSRLDSWKEIAAYLKRDIRTAQRWEKLEGLPVHRHQHDERGTAYAYSTEIDRWLEARTLRTSGSVETSAEAHGVAITSRPTPLKAMLIGGIAAIALGSVAFTRWWTPATEPHLTTLSVVFPAEERFPDWGPTVVLSPDATTIAYQGRGPIRLRRLDQLEALTVPGLDGRDPFYSPDGSSIGFFGSGKLFRVPIAGGRPEEIASIDIDFVGSADWGAHGEIVYAAPDPDGSHRLFRVGASGGTPTVIAAFDAQQEPAYWLTPQWVDSGRHVLSTVARSTASATTFQVVLVSVETGHSRLLLDDARHARVIGDVLVYWRDNALSAVRFDRVRLEPHGPHVTAWENVGARVRLRSWAVAGDTLVYWPGVRSSRRLTWVGRDGREEAVALPLGEYHSPRLSPDGRRLALIREGRSAEFGDVWQYDLTTGSSVRLTHQERAGMAIWTPDGAELVVSMREGGAAGLYRVQADGTGEPQRLGPADFLTGVMMQPVGWAGDRTLIVYQSATGHVPRYWALPLDGSAAPRPIVQDQTAGAGGVSPDGQWLAYSSLASGRREVQVAKLPEGKPTWQVSIDGGAFPLWSKTGRELFYRSGNRLMVAEVTVSGRTFTAGRPRHLLDRDIYEVEPGEPHYDVTRDGRFLITERGRADGPERLNVIQGWHTEVERRLRAAQ